MVGVERGRMFLQSCWVVESSDVDGCLEYNMLCLCETVCDGVSSQLSWLSRVR